MIRQLAAEVDPVAFARGHQAVLIHGTADRLGTLDAFAAALGFGSYFGRNLDAFLDCLRELDAPPSMVWVEAGRLRSADPAGYRGIVTVLRQWQAEQPAARIYLG